MKILCKKDIVSTSFKYQAWQKDKIYTIEKISGMMALKFENDILMSFYENDITHQNLWYYFYSPEETQNILRAKLINKMLDE